MNTEKTKYIWSGKELVFMLAFTFLFIFIVIKRYFFNFVNDYVFQNDLYAYNLMGLVMALLFLGALYFVALKPYKLSWDALGIRPFAKKYWLSIVLWTLILIGGSILTLILLESFGVTYENRKTESITSQLNIFNILIAYIGGCIISPFYEEIVYRGFFYRWFRRWGAFLATIISSTIFMLIHIPTYNALIVAFLSGVVCSIIYEKSNSIIPAMIIHSLFNTVALLGTILT